jgi:hypothetical protein
MVGGQQSPIIDKVTHYKAYIWTSAESQSHHLPLLPCCATPKAATFDMHTIRQQDEWRTRVILNDDSVMGTIKTIWNTINGPTTQTSLNYCVLVFPRPSHQLHMLDDHLTFLTLNLSVLGTSFELSSTTIDIVSIGKQ